MCGSVQARCPICLERFTGRSWQEANAKLARHLAWSSCGNKEYQKRRKRK